MKVLSVVLILAGVSVFGGCRTPPRAVLIHGDQRGDLEPAQTAAIHVDAAAPEGGDGSAARPLRALAAALATEKKSTVILAPGLYPGPIRCGMRLLRGPRTAVIYAEGEDTVVEASDGCVLEGVSVQGGGAGVVVAGGEVRLLDVAFSGQRRASVDVRAGAVLLERSELTASVSELTGVRVHAARASLRRVVLHGPFRTGVELLPPANEEAPGGALALEQVRFEEAANAVRARGPGRVLLSRLDVDRGRGVGVDLEHVTGEVRHLLVRGHELGVRVGGHARVTLGDAVLADAERAGLVVANATARVHGLVVIGSGSYGGVQVVGGQLELSDARFYDTHGDAMVVLDGELALTDASVSRPRSTEGSDGMGLQIRRTRARILGLDVLQPGYLGVLVAEASLASLEDVVVLGGSTASLSVETQGVARAGSLTLRPSAGLAAVVTTRAQLAVDAVELPARPSEGGRWMVAECSGGARLVTGWLRPSVPVSSSPCEGRARSWLPLQLPSLEQLDGWTGP